MLCWVRNGWGFVCEFSLPSVSFCMFLGFLMLIAVQRVVGIDIINIYLTLIQIHDEN